MKQHQSCSAAVRVKTMSDLIRLPRTNFVVRGAIAREEFSEGVTGIGCEGDERPDGAGDDLWASTLLDGGA